MGTSRTAAEFGAKITKLATATQNRSEAIVRAGANVTKTTMLTTAAGAGVSPAGKIAGKRWSVRYDLKRGSRPSALVRFVGPFHLVNNDTAAHSIAPRKRGRKALALPDGNVVSSVTHPGTRGKRIFEHGRDVAGGLVPKAMAAQVVKGWHEALR